MCSKKLLVLIGAGIVASTAAIAVADGIRDAGSKIRGDFGNSQATMRRSGSAYRMATPAATALAPAQIEGRSFSFEPSQTATQPGPANLNNPRPSTATTRQPARANRSFSYEPGLETFRSPTRGPARSPSPAYLLPKTDPGKYSGR